MRNPLRRKPVLEPVEAPPPPPVETAVLEACQACDAAAVALAAALKARRAALVRLSARTDPPGSSHIARLFARFSVWTSLAHAGVGDFAGLPHVSAASRRSFVQAARAAIAASATCRRPEPQPLEEVEHAQAK
jgi:hypothetical protein